ncbi:oxidoreductase [Streptomyces sp. NPDC087422]|uniref:oxidoreductase n=1 Tax=Streptomyces sp. NPDC087422 TaxID=3365786 RepID=UPI00380DD230
MWRAFRLGAAFGAGAGGTPAVRADAVAQLLLDGPPPEPGRVAALKLAGLRITGRLSLAGGTVAPYVQFDDCRFEDQVLLPECRAGSVRLVRCHLPRLEAARLQITGDLHLPQCVVTGGIRLTDAQIGTDLLLNQLTVRRDRHGRAIAADGLTVGQDLDAELLDLRGEFSLRSARVGGRLNLRGATLRNPYGRDALNAARTTVEHTVYLTTSWPANRSPDTTAAPGGTAPAGGGEPSGAARREFSAEGGVRLDDARVGNAVVIDRARFRLGEGQQLSLRRLQTPELRITLGTPPSGPMSLAGARVGRLTDAPQSWPGPGQVDLTDFSYEALTPRTAFPLRERVAWLNAATPEYSPGPYERLAAALRAGGEDAHAREVLLAKQRRRRESLPPAGRAWGWLQDVTVGYGYRPGRAAVWMAVLWALGALYFALHKTPPPAGNDYRPHWSPALYALDLLLPVIDLGQDNAWREVGVSQWVASLLTLLGWTLATTVAAGASRMLSRG